MRGLLFAAVDQVSSRGWEWKDFLTLVGVFITGAVGVYTVRISRKTTVDTSEGSSYARADRITQQQFDRLQKEIKDLREDAANREARHQRELEQRDQRIDELETRLDKSDRRVEQLAQALRDGDLPVPPPQA